MVKCDLTHNIIVFLKRVKVNLFKEFFSKNQKAFNSEIKTSTSPMTNRCFQNLVYSFSFLFVYTNPKATITSTVAISIVFTSDSVPVFGKSF